MAKSATDRLKFNPPLGVLPALQYLLPQQLQIDEAYQRSIEEAGSQALIRKIAQHWNWDLCQPLVVSRRENGDLFVIDGQHRLAAARLRGDIAQLPAVVVNYASAADEAASFVHLNQQRRPLTGLQIFHAALASGDSQACEIRDAIEAAGLKLGKHVNLQLGPPMTIINVAGIRAAWDDYGGAVTREALQLLGTAFAGQRLVYAGTFFAGLVALCRDQMGDAKQIEPGRFAVMSAWLGTKSQGELRQRVLQAKADDVNLNTRRAAAQVLRGLWAERQASGQAPAPRPAQAAPRPAPLTGPAFDADGKRWCDQCDRRVARAEVAGCRDPFCREKVAA